MIDVSDGLGLDLHRLADASGVGFRLDEVPAAVGATLDEALGGGEDYELLLAVSATDADGLVSAFEAGRAAPPGPCRDGDGRPGVAALRRRTARTAGLAAPVGLGCAPGNSQQIRLIKPIRL